MILRTLRSMGKNAQALSFCFPLMKLNKKAPFFIHQDQNYTSIFYQYNSKQFSTNTQKSSANVDSILSELESESLENFEEPFVYYYSLKEQSEFNYIGSSGRYGPNKFSKEVNKSKHKSWKLWPG